MLGRVLGQIPNGGNKMAQAVLNSKGKIIPRRTIRKLLKAEIHSESEKRKRYNFDDLILQKLGYSMYMPEKPVAPNHVPYSDNDKPASIQLPNDNDPLDDDGRFSLFEKPVTDQLINAELKLPQGEDFRSAKVIGRVKDGNGNVVGSYDENPFLNTLVYNVEFPDGDSGVRSECNR